MGAREGTRVGFDAELSGTRNPMQLDNESKEKPKEKVREARKSEAGARLRESDQKPALLEEDGQKTRPDEHVEGK